MGKREDVAKKFEATLLERALSKVAPKTAQRLHHDRIKFEMGALAGRGVGGYIGARRDRSATAEWNPGGGSANADIGPDLPMLRERSRDQVRNAPVAGGAINTDVMHVVGTGLSYSPAIDAKRLGITEERAQEWAADTKARFEAWASSPDCDVRRKLDFYSQTELVYRTWLESGDGFVLTPMIERGGETMLALQLIEADRVCNPRGARDSDTLQDGCVLDPATGEITAIHVAKYHPGDFRAGANSWEEVPMRGATTDRQNVLHLLDVLRPGQVRGVPWLAPIIEPLKQLNKWSDAELNAAVVSSIWAVFMEMDPDAFDDLYDDKDKSRIVNDAMSWSGKMESGKAINLLPGEKVSTQTPGRPNPEFDPFFQAVVRQIGMALGMPVEVLMMYFQSSYTAARGALLIAWRRWFQRRDKTAKLFCQPVFGLWLANEVSVGRIAAPGFFASREIRAAWCKAIWTGDGPGSVDEVKSATAAKIRTEMELTTLQEESIAYDGKDWEAKHRQRAKEIKMQRDDGTRPAAMPGQAAAPEPEAKPEEDDADDSDDDTEVPAVIPPRAPRPQPQPVRK